MKHTPTKRRGGALRRTRSNHRLLFRSSRDPGSFGTGALCSPAQFPASCGLYTGYTDSQGGFYKAVAYFPAAVAGLLFVVLLIGGALAKRSGPTIAAVAVAGAFLLGLTIGPDAPGSTQQAPGTGTVGTRADPAALWSGPVTCGWRKDESTAVEWVEGFDVPITDAAFLAARKLHDGKVTAVYLRGELGYAEDIGAYTGFPVDLEGVSSDGRTGAAVLNASGEIIFRWTCSGGP